MDSAKGLLCEFPWDGKSKGNDASVMTNLEKKTPQQSVVLLDEEPKAQDVTGMFFFPPTRTHGFQLFQELFSWRIGLQHHIVICDVISLTC